MNSLKHYLFQALEQACLSEGGDGDSAYLCEDYLEAATAFENWLKDNNNTYWTKCDRSGDNYIAFHNSQEQIWFAPISKKDDIKATIVIEDKYDFYKIS